MRTLALLTTVLALGTGCYTTQTTRVPVTDAQGQWARPGHVEQVQEVVERVRGEPAGGALAGALVGGVLFGHHGHPSLLGAAAGAAVGAGMSGGIAEHRSYEVLVVFDDGENGFFVFRDYSPFRPGDLVLLTPDGLVHR